MLEEQRGDYGGGWNKLEGLAFLVFSHKDNFFDLDLMESNQARFDFKPLHYRCLQKSKNGDILANIRTDPSGSFSVQSFQYN